MFLKHRRTGDLYRIEDTEELFNPLMGLIWGCNQAGEEEQEFTRYAKSDFIFPSGEDLPRCWQDIHYHLPGIPPLMASGAIRVD